MKTIMLLFMNSKVPDSSNSFGSGLNTSASYVIAAVIAFLILCYLIITLIKPEKF